MSEQPIAPILYIPHGGGPLPILDHPSHSALIEHLRSIGDRIPTPEAIVVVSAHWEGKQVNIASHPQPELFYDYSDFPAAAYNVSYPAPGDPELAESISKLLQVHRIPARTEPLRGWDHGVFIPLKLMFPKANIPILQVSLLSSLEAHEHIQIGEALASLRRENILLIGSGSSFHNMDSLVNQQPASQQRCASFNHWLKATLCETSDDYANRKQALLQWQQAPSARFCHPRAEHLMPLMVCFGAAIEAGAAECWFEGAVMEHDMLTFAWC